MANQEIMRDGSVLMFAPLSVTSFNSKDMKDATLSHLDGCSSIDINLKDTTEFDVSGLQIIKALQNYALVNGLELKISDISDVVQAKLNLLGVSL